MRHASRGFSPPENTDSKSSRLSTGRSCKLSWSVRWVIRRARSRAPRPRPAIPLRSALSQRALLGGGLEALEHHFPIAAERFDRWLVRPLAAQRGLTELDPRALALRFEPHVDEVVAVGDIGLARGRAVMGKGQ